MTGWREDNFLERLAQNSRKDAAYGQCPTAEMLCETIETEATSAVSDQLSQHIEECPACSEVRRRLALFDQQGSTASDAEVRENERRLDSWMKGFLASQELDARIPAPATEQKIIPFTVIPKARSMWNLQWALAAAAMLVIALGGVYIWRSIVELTHAPEVARSVPSEPVLSQNSQALPEPATEEPHPAAQPPKATSAHKPSESKTNSSGETAPTPRTEQGEKPKQSRIQFSGQRDPPVVDA